MRPADVHPLRSRFRQLHRPGQPLVMPNAWDAGSARLLASLGAAAIATTSSGFAATLGRPDGAVSADEAIAHVEALVAASPVPVSADLEDCFAAEPAGVADTIRRAVDAGAAGGSVEDFTRADGGSIYDLALATERVGAAVEAAAGSGFVLTARAENLIRGVDDLHDTIGRLQAYAQAGADVLFAPGLADLAQVRAVLGELERPVNVILVPGGPSVPELAEAGVAPVSVGGSLCWVGWAAVADAARELLTVGTHGYDGAARDGVAAARAAFG